MAGPGSNQTGTRSNNTLIHNASKRIPAIGPGAVTGLNAQLQGLETTFAGARALQAANIATAKSTAVLGRQTAKATAVSSMGSAVSNALSRGIVGSSVDSSNRAGVVAQLAADRAAVVNTRAGAISEAHANTLQALGQYYTGVGQVAAERAAQQAELAAQAYRDDTLNTNLSDFQDLVKRFMRGRRQDLPNSPNTPGQVGQPGWFDNGGTQGHIGGDGYTRPIGPIHSAGPHPY